jgi:hypothetical protein
MTRNPYLKVWVTCSYYDLATPFFGAENVDGVMNLDPSIRANLRSPTTSRATCSTSTIPSRKKFKADFLTFLGDATEPAGGPRGGAADLGLGRADAREPYFQISPGRRSTPLTFAAKDAGAGPNRKDPAERQAVGPHRDRRLLAGQEGDGAADAEDRRLVASFWRSSQPRRSWTPPLRR